MQHSEDHIALLKVRPRFETTTKHSIATLSERFRAALRLDDCPVAGKVRRGYMSLYPKLEEQHYWSPYLSVSFEEGETATVVRGIYGPKPTVWTMFVFFYAIIGFITLIVIIIGTANQAIGNSGAIMWSVPFLVLLFLSLYLVAFFGQKKGHDQIDAIHHFLERGLGEEVDW